MKAFWKSFWHRRGRTKQRLWTRLIRYVAQAGCRLFFPNVLSSAKVYPTLDAQNVRSLTVLGEICSAIDRLPPSAAITARLKADGNDAVASGRLTDIWRGHHDGKQVGIRVFRLYSERGSREAKKVRTECVQGMLFKTHLIDPLETGGNVEEVFPPERYRISGRGHEALSIGTHP